MSDPDANFLRCRRHAPAILALLLLTCGCASDGVIHLSPEETKVQPCRTSDDESHDIAVEQLETSTPVECDAVGALLTFPDGYEIPIPAIGANSGAQANGRSYTVTNLGIFGTVASMTERNDHPMWWGTPEAIAKAKDAGYGDEPQ